MRGGWGELQRGTSKVLKGYEKPPQNNQLPIVLHPPIALPFLDLDLVARSLLGCSLNRNFLLRYERLHSVNDVLLACSFASPPVMTHPSSSHLTSPLLVPLLPLLSSIPTPFLFVYLFYSFCFCFSIISLFLMRDQEPCQC